MPALQKINNDMIGFITLGDDLGLFQVSRDFFVGDGLDFEKITATNLAAFTRSGFANPFDDFRDLTVLSGEDGGTFIDDSTLDGGFNFFKRFGRDFSKTNSSGHISCSLAQGRCDLSVGLSLADQFLKIKRFIENGEGFFLGGVRGQGAIKKFNIGFGFDHDDPNVTVKSFLIFGEDARKANLTGAGCSSETAATVLDFIAVFAILKAGHNFNRFVFPKTTMKNIGNDIFALLSTSRNIHIRPNKQMFDADFKKIAAGNGLGSDIVAQLGHIVLLWVVIGPSGISLRTIFENGRVNFKKFFKNDDKRELKTELFVPSVV